MMWNFMIVQANAAGARWAGWIVGASLDAALLLAVISLAWLSIRDRVTPQVGYCLFLLVPLRLLLAPVVVPVPPSLARWTPSAVASSWLNAPRIAERPETRPAEAPSVPEAAPRSAVADAPQPAFATEPSPEPRVAAVARPSVPPVAEAPRLNLSAMVMTGWLVVVVSLLGRFVFSQLRFRRRLRRCSPIDALNLGVDLRDLSDRAGVRRTIRIVESDDIAAPAVWGMVRSTIILPKGITCSLSSEQQRWVLLHELAHVRRQDLIVVTLQRFAAILHFFNPAVWIANRMVHQLREYCCDDLALSLSNSSAVASGEAFVRILRRAEHGRSGLEGALGVFGLDARACCLRRVHRLLDTDRTIRSAPGAWTTLALILLGFVTLPHLRASNNGRTDEPQATAKKDEPAAAKETPNKEAPLFELRVVGPDGRPVPEALVQIRTDPHPTAKDVRRGTFDRDSSYGSFVKTDAEGRLIAERPQAPERYNLDVTIPGFGPYWAGWSSASHEEPVPAQFTADLDAAWSVGGIIVDDAGKPLEGVSVQPHIEFKQRPGVTGRFYTGARMKTDASGKWRFDSVPVSMQQVHVEINHPDFKAVRQPLPRVGFGLEPGQEPSTKIALERGLTLVGKVTDEAGNPIVGALVRTKFHNDVREGTTGPDGAYKLVGCEPRSARIVVSAKGKATDMKELNVESGMAPVDFQMKPGGTIRVRVLDEQGKPAPKARIFFQRWRGMIQYFEFDNVNQYADENGVWVWHEAPLDEFKADICPPDGMQLEKQPLIARDEEYVFRTTAPLVVNGKVVDALTKEPVKAFRVVPGVWFSETNLFWVQRDSFPGTDGRFQFRSTRGELAQLIRIEADGYQAAVSRNIKSTEGSVAIDFELKKGTNIAAKVVTAEGLPATGAKIALGIAGSQINIKNGDIDEISTYSDRATTDDAGRFLFPAQSTDFQLVIAHPAGFALIKSTPEWDPARDIQLEPWSRVEGTFRVGRSEVANARISIYVPRPNSYGESVPHISSQHETTTGPDGRFVFDRVIPGAGRIGRDILLTVDDGATEVTSSCRIPAEFPAGKTIQMDLGGTGRAVVGALQPAEGVEGAVRWNFALVSARLPDPEPRGPYITASVDRDGKFRIDDVPPGDFRLDVRFDRYDAGHLYNHRLHVPSTADDVSAPPIDLGTLKLERSQLRQ